MDSYTVSELNDTIKQALHTKFKNYTITVTGEISNLKISGGRHTFLTLKDDNSQISVAFWGSVLNNQHGDNVEVSGRIEHYAKSGNINLIGSSIKLTGVGSVHTEYERLKMEYEKKGFFNNKKPLPASIKKIGIVTSESGAALQDFLYVLEKNEFAGDVYIYDCIVQGSKCPASVAAGVKFFNSPFYPVTDDQNHQVCEFMDSNLNDSYQNDSDPGSDTHSDNSNDSFDPFATSASARSKIVKNNQNNQNNQNNKKQIKDAIIRKNTYGNDDSEVEVDCIVVARGGGSFEDLMGFSHPKVIEAIYASKKYVISAVGHEPDNMLSDDVANYRAPTPSIAGAVVSSVNFNNKKKLLRIETDILKIKKDLLQTLHRYQKSLKRFALAVVDPTALLNKKLDDIVIKAKSHIKTKLIAQSHKLKTLNDVLTSNDVSTLLENGFMMLTDLNNSIVSDPKELFDKNLILIHASGRYNISIKNMDNKTEKNELKPTMSQRKKNYKS